MRLQQLEYNIMVNEDSLVSRRITFAEIIYLFLRLL